jgi:hypothetical protein
MGGGMCDAAIPQAASTGTGLCRKFAFWLGLLWITSSACWLSKQPESRLQKFGMNHLSNSPEAHLVLFFKVFCNSLLKIAAISTCDVTHEMKAHQTNINFIFFNDLVAKALQIQALLEILICYRLVHSDWCFGY